MALLHLVTGRAGAEHVTGADHGALNAALLMAGNFVLNTGNKFSASIVTNNSIKILDGELIMQGRHARLKPGLYEEVTIENGAQDYKRNDLIVVRYTKDENTGIENTSFVVIKGTPDATTATDPEYTAGDIINGDLVCDMPLYRVPIDGLNVGELVPLFEVADSLGARLDAIINGTTAVGNAKKLDGHNSDYFATAEEVQNIQTTSKATLSQAGWYRVARCEKSYGNAVLLGIKNIYASSGCVSQVLLFNTAYKNESIVPISLASKNTQTITKARYTTDGTFNYLEVYYTLNEGNPFGFTVTELTHNVSTDMSDSFPWQAITPTLTSETLDGVTVTTTYDIPANASPVTDLDIAELETDILNNSIWTELTSGFDLNNALGKYRTSSTTIVRSLLNLPPNVSGGEITVEWYSSNKSDPKTYGVQILRNTNVTACDIYIRIKGGSTWVSWIRIATTADLANYFKNTGGAINGNVTIGNSTDATQRVLFLENTARKISHEIYSDGDYYLKDRTNGKDIIKSTADGKITVNADVNGTASGNLPLDVGGTQRTITGSTRVPVKFHNSADNNVGLQFNGASGSLGFLGVYGKDNPAFITADGANVRTLHHDGNSKQIVVSDTPLTSSDTNKIRIY